MQITYNTLSTCHMQQVVCHKAVCNKLCATCHVVRRNSFGCTPFPSFGPATPINFFSTNSFRLNTIVTKYIELSCLPRIKYCGLPISVTWPVYRDGSDEESCSGVSLERIYISSVSSECHAHEPKRREEFLSLPRFSGYHQKIDNFFSFKFGLQKLHPTAVCGNGSC